VMHRVTLRLSGAGHEGSEGYEERDLSEHIGLSCRLVGPPNGVRLSCGAEQERSQIKDYHRERGADSFRRVLGGTPSTALTTYFGNCQAPERE